MRKPSWRLLLEPAGKKEGSPIVALMLKYNSQKIGTRDCAINTTRYHLEYLRHRLWHCQSVQVPQASWVPTCTYRNINIFPDHHLSHLEFRWSFLPLSTNTSISIRIRHIYCCDMSKSWRYHESVTNTPSPFLACSRYSRWKVRRASWRCRVSTGSKFRKPRVQNFGFIPLYHYGNGNVLNLNHHPPATPK